MPKDNLLLHHDNLIVLDKLSDEEVGKLLKELYSYSLYINNPEVFKKPSGLSGLLDCLCDTFKARMDRDLESYNLRVLNSKENGKKGGRPKNPKPRKPVPVPVPVSNDIKEKNYNKKSFSFFEKLNLLEEKTIADLLQRESLKLTDSQLNKAREACIDYHKSRGTKVKDWLATFRTWLRNYKDFNQKPGIALKPGTTNKRKPGEGLDEILGIN